MCYYLNVHFRVKGLRNQSYNQTLLKLPRNLQYFQRHPFSERCDSIPKLYMDLLEAIVLRFCKPETLKSFENRDVKCGIHLPCNVTQHWWSNDNYVHVYKHQAMTTNKRAVLRRFLTLALNVSEFLPAHPERFTDGKRLNSQRSYKGQ